MKFFKNGNRGAPGISRGPSPMHKAYACQQDLQDVAHRTNTCTTICIAKRLRRPLHMASHDQRVDDDVHGRHMGHLLTMLRRDQWLSAVTTAAMMGHPHDIVPP